jgi:hypothetical protein
LKDEASSQLSSSDDTSSTSCSGDPIDEENGFRVAREKAASSGNRRCFCIILLVIVLVTAASFVIVLDISSKSGRTSGVKTSAPVESSVDTAPFVHFDFATKSDETSRPEAQEIAQEGVEDATAFPIHGSNEVETEYQKYRRIFPNEAAAADLARTNEAAAAVEIKNKVEKKSAVQRFLKWQQENPVQAQALSTAAEGLVSAYYFS